MEITNSRNIQVQPNQNSRDASKDISNNSFRNKEDFKAILTSEKDNQKNLKTNNLSPKKFEVLNNKKSLNSKEDNISNDVKTEDVVSQEENIDKADKSVYDLLLELLQSLQGANLKQENSFKDQGLNVEDVKTSLQDIFQALQSGKQDSSFIKLKIGEIPSNGYANLKESCDKLVDIVSSAINSKESSIDLLSLEQVLGNIEESINTLSAQVKEPMSFKEELSVILQQAITKATDKDTRNINVETSRDNNEDLKNLSSNKEDKFLESIIKGKDSNEFNKVLLMSQNASSLKAPIEEVNLCQGLTVNRGTMVNDIIKSVKFMELNGLKELTVNINPKELGNIVIRITMDANVMKARIVANNKEAYNLISSNMEELKSSLENSNLKVQEVQVGLHSENSTAFSSFKEGKFNEEFQQRNFSSSKSNLEEDKAIEEIKEKELEEESNIDILA